MIDNDRLGINEHTTIITQTNFSNLSNFINNLRLKGSYSLHQKYMIYQLLRTTRPTLEQFQNLYPFIAPEDFKIIIRIRRRIPQPVLAMANAYMNKRGIKSLNS